MTRIWEHDHTVWKPDSAEITNRLGWLHSAENMFEEIPHIQEFTKNILADGINRIVLLGMGGSSLAPEVFSKSFGIGPGYLDLTVLDSTDPEAIKAVESDLNLSKTLFIVATKSGGTVETLSLFRYFYNLVQEELGSKIAGNHFIGITDPESKLEALANEYNFREIFLNDPNIGGRYSALSYFGLVPAGLIGLNLNLLLERSLTGLCSCENCDCALDDNNYGAQLGAILGSLASQGRDKLTLFTSPEISSFGNWVEQLIAESTGKEGKGILPVVGEDPGDPGVYGADRLFVFLSLDDDPARDGYIRSLTEAGHPVVWIQLDDLYDLGGQFFLWEIATAVAGHILEINPFDQPNVESAKILARKMVTEYQVTGKLPDLALNQFKSEELFAFIDQNLAEGGYIALQAYLHPTEEIHSWLQKLRLSLRDKYQAATTVGYGPRFLHSTGQLHKGDAGKGVFIQIISQLDQDLPIPDQAGNPSSSIGFEVLKQTQAQGDAQALSEAGRNVFRLLFNPELLN
jgi:glucose-6-phosphate isomerase